MAATTLLTITFSGSITGTVTITYDPVAQAVYANQYTPYQLAATNFVLYRDIVASLINEINNQLFYLTVSSTAAPATPTNPPTPALT